MKYCFGSIAFLCFLDFPTKLRWLDTSFLANINTNIYFLITYQEKCKLWTDILCFLNKNRAGFVKN